MDLMVFTLPSCPSCPMAKQIAADVAEEFGVSYREVNLATKEGMDKGLAYSIMSTPSIAIDQDVIVRGKLVSKEKLREEVRKRIEKWREKGVREQV